jgi:NTP pyrophosphatase (non-canonical NTP hydrolase)
MDIKDLQEKAKKFIDEREWRQFQTSKELAINMSVESNELLELFQWRDGKEIDDLLKSGKDPELYKKIQNETSDIFFSALAIADHLNFDMGDAFLSKMDALAKRYKIEEVKGKVIKIPEYPENKE